MIIIRWNVLSMFSRRNLKKKKKKKRNAHVLLSFKLVSYKEIVKNLSSPLSHKIQLHVLKCSDKSQFEIWNASILKTVLLLIILPRFKIV